MLKSVLIECDDDNCCFGAVLFECLEVFTAMAPRWSDFLPVFLLLLLLLASHSWKTSLAARAATKHQLKQGESKLLLNGIPSNAEVEAL